MSTAVTYPHIVKIEGQPAHLERLPRVRVSQVAVEYVKHCSSPDEICFHYPHLKLAEVHSAMAYYFDHQAEIDAEIAEEQRMVEEWRKSLPPSPIETRIERLRKALAGPEPVHALRREVELFASEGQKKEQIHAFLHWLLQDVRRRADRRETDEDAVLDVLVRAAGNNGAV